MPRNKAGGGRSGMRHVKRQQAYEAAEAAAPAAVEDATTPTSATVQYATPMKEDELEEQTAANSVDEAGAQVKKK
eukprot:5334275-Prymnesium_polylepis.1